jgi:hypothetical protein
METKRSRILRSLLYLDVTLTALPMALQSAIFLPPLLPLNGNQFDYLYVIFIPFGLIGLLGLAACLFRQLHALQIVAAVFLLVLYLSTSNLAYVMDSQPWLLAGLLLNAAAAFALSASIHKVERE